MICNFCGGSTRLTLMTQGKLHWHDCRICFGSGIHNELGRKQEVIISFTAKLKKKLMKAAQVNS